MWFVLQDTLKASRPSIHLPMPINPKLVYPDTEPNPIKLPALNAPHLKLNQSISPPTEMLLKLWQDNDLLYCDKQ